MADDAKASILIELKNNASKGLNDFNKQFASAINPIQNIGRNAAIAIAAIGTAIVAAGALSIREAAKFQQTQMAFTTMLGSGEKAMELLGQLSELAAKTPFTLPDVEQNAKLLLAMGIEAEKVVSTMSMLGDVAAGLSVPIGNIALAFGQVKTANQLYGTELRQFVNNGVPLLSQLAEQFNKTEAQIKKMVEEGAISFAAVEQAFIDMTSEGGRFYNMMQAQNQTFLGQISNLKDNFVLAARELGAGLIPPLTEGLTMINTAFTNFRQNSLASFTPLKQTADEIAISMLNMGVNATKTAEAFVAVGGSAASFLPTMVLLQDVAVDMDANLQTLIDSFLKVKDANKLTDDVMQSFVKNNVPLLAELAKQFNVTEKEVVKMTKNGEVGLQAVELALKNISLQKTPLKSFLNESKQLLIKFLEAFEPIWKIIEPTWKKTWKAITSTWDVVVSLFKAGLEFFQMMWEDWGDTIIAIVSFLWNKVTFWFNFGVELLGGIMEIFAGLMTGDWERIKNGAVNMAQGMWNNIVELFNSGVQLAIAPINSLINKLNELGASITPISFNLDGLKMGLDSSGTAAVTTGEEVSGFDKFLQNLKNTTKETSDETGKLAAGLGGGGGGGGSLKDGAEKAQKALQDLQDQYGDFQETVSAVLQTVIRDHSEKLADLREELRSVNQDIKELMGAFQDDQTQARQELGEDVVEQEKKIADIQEQIEEEKKKKRDEMDYNKLSDLKNSLVVEQAALTRNKDLILSIDNEVREARRRGRLTDFERIVEDYKNQQIERQKDYDDALAKLNLNKEETLKAIKTEEDAYLRLRNTIVTQSKEATELFTSYVESQEKKTVDSINKMIDKFKELSSTMQNTGSGKTVKNLDIPKFANGVTNFSGGLAMVGEQGAEMVRLPRGSDVVPNNKLGGNTINLYISGNNVLDKNDVIEKIGDPIISILKRHFAVA